MSLTYAIEFVRSWMVNIKGTDPTLAVRLGHLIVELLIAL